MTDPMSPERRALLALAGGATVMAAAPASVADSVLPAPGLVFAFEATILIGAPIEQGMIDGVRRRIIPITGGRFAGPRLSGEILPGGADWQAIRADGTAEILARYTLRAADGTIVGIENPGIRRGPEAVLKRLAAGEAVDPSLYYFRTTPRFTAPAGPHRWLAESVFVATAARYADHVVLRAFAVE